MENRKFQEVTGWVPLRGPRSGLQLVVLLDDSSVRQPGPAIERPQELSTALPPTAQVAIGYMRNGSPNLVQNFTTDHAAGGREPSACPAGTPGDQRKPLFLPFGSGQAMAGRRKQRSPGGDHGHRWRRPLLRRGASIPKTLTCRRLSATRRKPESSSIPSTTGARAAPTGFALVTDGGQNYLTQVSGSTGGKVYTGGLGEPGILRAVSLRHPAQTSESI